MFDFFNDAVGADKVYLYFAFIGTITFMLLNILTVIGLFDDFDFDLDLDSDFDFELDSLDVTLIPLKIFSFRGLLAFVMFFGWGGYLYHSLFWAFFYGILAFVVVGTIYYFIKKLQHSGSYSMTDTIGKKGKVYLKIKGDNTSVGKVMIVVNSGLKEMDAISDESLEYNDNIIVVDVKDNLLVVKKHKEEQ